MTSVAKPAHVPALDGLRGAAVAAVVAFHLGYLRGGYLGVDLFFTLSGFLITRLLIAEHQSTGGISLGSFLGRRARRLMPAMLVMLAGVALATNFWGSPSDYQKIRGDSLATLLYVANWRQVLANSNYWELFARPSPLQHTWSLAIEEQFYLFWPLLVTFVLVVLGRRMMRRSEGTDPGQGRQRMITVLLVGTLVIGALSALLAALMPDGSDGTNRIYFGSDTRIGSILFGAALALAVARFGELDGKKQRMALEVAAGVAVVGLGIGWVRLSGTSGLLYDGGLALAAIAAVVIIAAISHSQSGPLAKGFSFAPLCWLGLISYGLYLWHWPVITFVTAGRVGFGGTQLTLLRIVLSLGLAIVSYFIVEKPIRSGALTGWPAKLSAPIGFAAVAALVLWATIGGVTPISEQPTGREKLRVADDPVPPVKTGTRMLMVGDSGAYAIGGHLREVAAEHDIEMVNRGTPACGLVRGDNTARYPGGELVNDPPGCGDWPERWAGHLTEVEPDTVLLMMVAPGGVSRRIQGKWRTECDPKYDAWYQESLEQALTILASKGARVSVTTVGYFDSTVDPDGSHEHTDCKNKTIKRAAKATGAEVIDLWAWACKSDGTCRNSVRRKDGSKAELRPDGMHYTGAGADSASRYIIQQISSR